MNSETAVKRKPKKARKVLKILLIVLAVILGLLLLTAAYAYFSLSGAVSSIEKLDEAGHLYVVDYTGSMSNPFLNAFPNLVSNIGCSAFAAETEEGEIITGRNYDYVHFDPEGNFTCVDVLVRMHPEGKYASINSCDSMLFNIIGGKFQAGSLDDPDAVSKMALGLVPYSCEDGINETGLSAAILQVDTREGETTTKQNDAGKKNVVATSLLREILDNCATVEEAKELAANVNMQAALGADYHLFVVDAEGNSTVLEWRYNELQCIDTDACTNFYVGSDDGCDSYKRGTLYETFSPVVSLYNEYHTGYGHGYARFNTLIAGLDENRSGAGELAVLTEDEAMELLGSVAQESNPDVKTSGTLWSIVFNNTEKTMELSLLRDYSQSYKLGF